MGDDEICSFMFLIKIPRIRCLNSDTLFSKNPKTDSNAFLTSTKTLLIVYLM